MSPFVVLISLLFTAQPMLTQIPSPNAPFSTSGWTLSSLSSASNANFPASASSNPPSISTPTGSVLGVTYPPILNTPPNTTGSVYLSHQPINTRRCNGYVELCERKLSNVSLVVAHNSPFVIPHNAASNQELAVLTQLADGIRGLQFETHYPNSTAGLHLCHTSCDLLDAGTLESYLTIVEGWLAANPYEVIAIMMGNNNRITPSTYVVPFQNSGLLPYLYTPPNSNMTLPRWPTLREMILHGKRVVVMLDYLANQTEVPWLLDEFAYQWETAFSPTDPSFPCTEQRPPKQADGVSRNMMYMLNHNLNIDVQVLGTDVLIPAYTLLDEVNAVSGNGSLGLNVEKCTAMWGRPPN